MLKITARTEFCLTVSVTRDALPTTVTARALDSIAEYMYSRSEIQLVDSESGLVIFMFNQYRDIKNTILDRANEQYRNTIANMMKF